MATRSSLQEHVFLEVTSRGDNVPIARAICERLPRAVRVRPNPLFYKYNLPDSPQLSYFKCYAMPPSLRHRRRKESEPNSTGANDVSAPPDLDSLYGLPSEGLCQICAPPLTNGGSVVEAARSSRRPLRTKQHSR
jgi:hypothetical protein